jgi:integrase
MRFLPAKTSQKTGRTVTYPLLLAPMVMEELVHWPMDRRRGPIIVSEASGLPYKNNAFSVGWREDRAAAGITEKAWARDLRASGLTEGRASAASLDDAAKVAGHSGTQTTAAVYDRANLEAAERFALARIAKRIIPK